MNATYGPSLPGTAPTTTGDVPIELCSFSHPTQTDIRSTDAYIHADMTIKEKALARTTPTMSKPGRYQPRDRLLAFLESL